MAVYKRDPTGLESIKPTYGLGGHTMSHKIAQWLYRVFDALAELGTVQIDTGCSYVKTWGPFKTSCSYEHDYARSELSWDRVGVGIAVSDEIDPWLIYILLPLVHHLRLDCRQLQS